MASSVSRIRKTLPPFTMLIAFEAAARSLSFTKAGEELNVSQPAVSRQIKALERRLGLRLFERGHRSLSLTDAGVALSKTMGRSLADISLTLSELAQHEETELAISALPAFATLWLAPRLHSFCSLHPRLRVRLVSQERPVDLERGGIDIALRFGQGAWPDGEAELLFHDHVFPVCSPGYAERHGRADRLEDIGRHRLIAYEQVEPDWLSWREWLSETGHANAAIQVCAHYSNYPDAITATLDGQGIALGWRALVTPYIEAGRLVRLGTAETITRSAHFAVVSRSARHKKHIADFVEWLTAVVG